MIVALAALALGCDRRAEPATGESPPVEAAVLAAAGDASAGPAVGASPLAYPALRCSECHNTMYDEWSTASHARARRSPSYRSMQAHAGDATCDGCHAPLAALLPGDPLADEGVTCEVCHNIKAVEVEATRARFEVTLDRVKYGPLCDAKDHYFHKMGCSPLHREAELCAACHFYYRPLPGGGTLPVFTEYEEWNEGPYQARPCQSCHMPGVRAEVAVGEGERDGVSNHGLLGGKGDLRQRALKAKARLQLTADRVELELEITNHGAGHHVPTGLPARRIVVRAMTLDEAQAPQGTAEHRFGRVLVDDRGTPVPFYQATRVGSDDRIGPKQSRKVKLSLAAPPAGELRLEIVWISMDPAIARLAGIEEVEEVPLLRAALPLRPRSGRALKRTLELKP